MNLRSELSLECKREGKKSRPKKTMFSSDFSGAAPPSWCAAATMLSGAWVNRRVFGPMAAADRRGMMLENRLAAALRAGPEATFTPIPTVRNWKVKVDSGHYERSSRVIVISFVYKNNRYISSDLKTIRKKKIFIVGL